MVIHFRLEVLAVILLPVIQYVSSDDLLALPQSFTDGADSVSEFEVYSEYDLLGAISIPFPDPKTQYIEDDGHDGFPAFGFRAGSDVKIAHRQILPEKLSSEFSILISAKPKTRRGAFIFAVVNPYDTVVELGVRIVPDGPITSIVSLYYTDFSQISSHSIANFTVPKSYNKWLRFAFRVTIENVTLFYNCNETETVLVQRNPIELVFDSASTLYLAQAGPKFGEPYEVNELTQRTRRITSIKFSNKIKDSHSGGYSMFGHGKVQYATALIGNFIVSHFLEKVEENAPITPSEVEINVGISSYHLIGKFNWEVF